MTCENVSEDHHQSQRPHHINNNTSNNKIMCLSGVSCSPVHHNSRSRRTRVLRSPICLSVRSRRDGSGAAEAWERISSMRAKLRLPESARGVGWGGVECLGVLWRGSGGSFPAPASSVQFRSVCQCLETCDYLCRVASVECSLVCPCAVMEPPCKRYLWRHGGLFVHTINKLLKIAKQDKVIKLPNKVGSCSRWISLPFLTTF